MKVIFPPLVEQGFSYFKQVDSTITKPEVFRLLVANHILNENGLPTTVSLDEGWIKEYTEEENLTFEQFLKVYPVFKKFKQQHFTKIAGFWEIDQVLRHKLLVDLDYYHFSPEETDQVEAYLDARFEEDPDNN